MSELSVFPFFSQATAVTIHEEDCDGDTLIERDVVVDLATLSVQSVQVTKTIVQTRELGADALSQEERERMAGLAREWLDEHPGLAPSSC